MPFRQPLFVASGRDDTIESVAPRRRRSTERRLRALEKARLVLEAVADGSRNTYEGYREVYAIYIDTSGLVEELKPLFRLPGVYPDGPITVDDDFRRTVIAAATDWLKHNSPAGG